MNALARYWSGLSPALRRYYIASVWPSLGFLGLVALHDWAGRALHATALPWRIGFALGPVLALGWMFAAYLRFLRDCDELERRIELDALAWSAGITLHAGMATMFLIDADLLDGSGRHVAGGLCVVLVASYALVRDVLHRRHA